MGCGGDGRLRLGGLEVWVFADGLMWLAAFTSIFQFYEAVGLLPDNHGE